MTGLEDETYSNPLGMNLTKIEAVEFYEVFVCGKIESLMDSI